MKITAQHYHRLIDLESGVQYQEPPVGGGHPFVAKSGEGKVALSAPHGAKTYRNNRKQIWHEEDEYTAGLALLLNEAVNVPVVAMMRQSLDYDPNYMAKCAYKDELGRLIQQSGIQFVIDLHGAALFSDNLEPQQTIDLGLRNAEEAGYSMDVKHVEFLENLLQASEGSYDPNCFVVKRNGFPAAGDGTVTTYVSRQIIKDNDKHVQAIQIEMKPQVRVARRFPTASLYPSCGPYEAHPQCIMHMIQSLADFVEYLNGLE